MLLALGVARHIHGHFTIFGTLRAPSKPRLEDVLVLVRDCW